MVTGWATEVRFRAKAYILSSTPRPDWLHEPFSPYPMGLGCFSGDKSCRASGWPLTSI